MRCACAVPLLLFSIGHAAVMDVVRSNAKERPLDRRVKKLVKVQTYVWDIL